MNNILTFDEMKQLLDHREGVIIEKNETITTLQADNKHMKESLCTMPKCEHLDKLQADNTKMLKALNDIDEVFYTGNMTNRIEKIRPIVKQALSIDNGG